ncbi:hypothetical protein RHGRI_011987 [Rhododendron griersonianum]|uniref:Enoyl-CoA hydratase n=1 Tax=Rhododendron griersonianum TaxID=479676 RepID=A0AAV6KPE8_9ERIC|nr:hypothetical protein RHGRI_011987 [Rhododendron griersonianum]KAG5554311.1 hypothetical protein RHGRI_011987 [Rhododendron griersonianum]
MVTLSSVARSMGRRFVGYPKPYLSQFRTLLLQSTSQCVNLRRLSNSDSGIVEVNLDRPGVKNAIGWDMLRGLQHSFEAISRDSSANVLMIRSSVPKVFCAGADLKVGTGKMLSYACNQLFVSIESTGTRVLDHLSVICFDWQERKTMSSSEVQDFVNTLRSTFSYLEALHIPSIAVVEGAAFGGGLEMALSCDLRICGEDAVLSMPETGLAIIPGKNKFPAKLFSRAGGTQRLPRLVGRSVAKELIFTGRKICGRDAVSMGLANYCVPSGEAHLKALEIAQSINQKGPLAIRLAKRAINEGFEVDLASALALEEECYEQLLNTKDRLEGLAAFAEKRKPKYVGE